MRKNAEEGAGDAGSNYYVGPCLMNLDRTVNISVSQTLVLVVQSCLTHVLQPTRLSMDFSRQEWIAIPFSRGSSLTQELNPGLLHCRWIRD